jgi:solute carrier family 10 (sodium/bile acid cotransporter), member 7
MKTLLARHWFLVTLVTGVALACLVPAWFGWAEHLDPRVVVAPALFLMAWTLPSRSLARVLLRPWPALWAVAISYGLVPVCGWLAGTLVPVDDFRIGLLIVTCVPCTLASAALWTRMAGGDEATALLVTLLTTASSWLVTPAWLAGATGMTVAVDALAMMKDLLLSLVVPVAVGQLIQALGPLARLATRHKQQLGVVSQFLILVVLLKAAVYVSARLRQEPAVPGGLSIAALALLCVGIHLLALGSGLWSSRLLCFDHPSQAAVAFACSQKTLPVALLVFERYFPQYPLAVVPLAFYHFGQLIVDTLIADRLARRKPALADVPAGAVV